jgi:sugar phosphate isomerase/epimerase
MKTIKGPAIFLAQFAGDAPPFNNLAGIAGWAAGHGYKGVQLPSWDTRLFDLALAAESSGYCDEIKGVLSEAGVQLTELSTHLQGQLIAVHPAYDTAFDGFAAPEVRGNPAARKRWAVEQLLLAAKASRNLGLTAHATFSGALAWPFVYPWPQRPAGLVEAAFDELAGRWTPILNAFDEVGVDLCYEIHPSEDLHDGITFEMFLERVNNHRRCNILYDPSHFLLQQLDYLQFIDIYHPRIRMFHAKDTEFNPSGRQGVYSGFQPWVNRAGRFRSLGDGQIEFGAIFSRLSQYGFNGWAVLEWECCLKDSEQRAAEGAPFIAAHIIQVATRAFDDFAASGVDQAANVSCWDSADGPSHSPRHGGRWRRRLYRRSAPHRGPDRRPVRIGRRRAVI